MAKVTEYIDLTSALSLVAFGLEITGDAFAKAMNVEHFGLERAEAINRFSVALKCLQQAVLAGDLELWGRLETGYQASATRLSERIPYPSGLTGVDLFSGPVPRHQFINVGHFVICDAG